MPSCSSSTDIVAVGATTAYQANKNPAEYTHPISQASQSSTSNQFDRRVTTCQPTPRGNISSETSAMGLHTLRRPSLLSMALPPPNQANGVSILNYQPPQRREAAPSCVPSIVGKRAQAMSRIDVLQEPRKGRKEIKTSHFPTTARSARGGAALQPTAKASMTPIRKKFSRRVTTGCVTCRKRKKKCDESKPECGRCLRSGYVCRGYSDKEAFWRGGDVEQLPRTKRLSCFSQDGTTDTVFADDHALRPDARPLHWEMPTIPSPATWMSSSSSKSPPSCHTLDSYTGKLGDRTRSGADTYTAYDAVAGREHLQCASAPQILGLTKILGQESRQSAAGQCC